jgi:hypothetical protein
MIFHNLSVPSPAVLKHRPRTLVQQSKLARPDVPQLATAPEKPQAQAEETAFHQMLFALH